MLIVHPSLPVKSVSELVAYAKANPGKLSYGSFGIGTYAHLSMEELKQRTGMKMQHVPYRGAAPGLEGLLGNEVSVLLLNLSSVDQYAKSGQVRLIAAATENACRCCRTFRPFPKPCRASVHRFGSVCGGRQKCRPSSWRKSTPTS
jgi:tripartite-type tricarboxylate transporter receptor subunit TctC